MADRKGRKSPEDEAAEFEAEVDAALAEGDDIADESVREDWTEGDPKGDMIRDHGRHGVWRPTGSQPLGVQDPISGIGREARTRTRERDDPA